MIHNYEQLAVVRQQLALAEDILVSWHKELYAKNPRNYALYTEGDVDMILQLRAEIDEFLKIQPAPPDAPSPAETNGAQPIDTPAASVSP